MLCNCDDPFESNFFKYFVLNFNKLGLKKLIATCYAGSPVAKTFPFGAYKAIVTKVYDIGGDGAINMEDIKQLFEAGENTLVPLEGDGDFRSEECVELLREADIVCTNPPFSLFREYVAQLIEFGKDFLIVGNKNAITYKEIFPLIKDNELWIGTRNINTDFWLKVPEGREYEKVVNGEKLKHIMACWFTNLDIKKRHEELPLAKRYNPEHYPKYDNYDAINVDKVALIPYDYDGVMGVPITFLGQYCPEQFEIVGNEYSLEIEKGRGYVKGKRMYSRIFIRRKV